MARADGGEGPGEEAEAEEAEEQEEWRGCNRCRMLENRLKLIEQAARFPPDF